MNYACSDSQGFDNQFLGEDSQIRNSSPHIVSSLHNIQQKKNL